MHSHHTLCTSVYNCNTWCQFIKMSFCRLPHISNCIYSSSLNIWRHCFHVEDNVSSCPNKLWLGSVCVVISIKYNRSLLPHDQNADAGLIHVSHCNYVNHKTVLITVDCGTVPEGIIRNRSRAGSEQKLYWLAWKWAIKICWWEILLCNLERLEDIQSNFQYFFTG